MLIEFVSGAEEKLAESLLQACNNSLEMAINMHMEGIEGATSAGGASGSGEENGNGRSKGQTEKRKKKSSKGEASTSRESRVNIEDDEDEVRAPIPQKQETLIEPGYEGYQLRNNGKQQSRIKTVFDGFRNFGSEASM